ncbi:sensor histidine kinase [Pedobacter sp. G11]|uniref:sensor histidine kinase n=1 Tax=Pedobacter sp. G11 TaxID=2482728 RepID=UPI00143D6122|nr:sensor histidine kinase [Pedobacter sp. G11]
MNDLSTTKNGIRNFLECYRYHFYLWGIFIFYEIAWIGLYSGFFGNPVRYFIVYSLNIGLFYFHALVTLKWSIQKSKSPISLIPVLFVLQTAAYVGMMYGIQKLMINYTRFLDGTTVKFDYQFCLGTIFRAFYFILFSTGYYFLQNYIEERRRTKALEKNKLENMVNLARSENAYLRAQINPHFLFNTLNFLYHNARDKAPVAAEGISALSEMMRYAVDSDFNKEYVDLGSELEQVENLINLHQLRENHSLCLRLFYDDEVRDVKFIPLVLITIVENIFKHGDLTNSKVPGTVHISFDEGLLSIRTKNLIAAKRFKGSLHSGMSNISKRLQFSYGERAVISFGEVENNIFLFSLTVRMI